MKKRDEFRKAWIVGGDEGAEVGVVGGLSGLDCLRVEGTGNLFGDEGRGISSCEEGMDEVDSVGVQVIWVAVPDSQRKGDVGLYG